MDLRLGCGQNISFLPVFHDSRVPNILGGNPWRRTGSGALAELAQVGP